MQVNIDTEVITYIKAYIFKLGIGSKVYRATICITIPTIVFILEASSFLIAFKIPDSVWFNDINKGTRNMDFKYLPASSFLNTNTQTLSPKK